jgi:hypothetical protein
VFGTLHDEAKNKKEKGCGFRWKWKIWKDASKDVSVEKEVSMEEEKDEWEMAPRSLKRVRKIECEEIMLKNQDLWNK